DGVSGTNCPIQPGSNWTYQFQTKDQIGTFFYFPSINFQKAAGGFGAIRVNNRVVIAVPFDRPDKMIRSMMDTEVVAYEALPDIMLMNGKGPYGHKLTKDYESFTVTSGKIKPIQNHQMVVVETEGSYTNQITLDSLDVHVGQSYSVLVTMNQNEADYYMVASPKLINVSESNNSSLVGVGVLHYSNSAANISGPLPSGPDSFDLDLWNLTTGAARPNPQGTFNVNNITISQTFILEASSINNVSYITPETPLKLADQFDNGSGVYQLDWFPTKSVNQQAAHGVSVVSGTHKGWIELVLLNAMDGFMDSWHLNGFGFYVVGLGNGKWEADARSGYNLQDPVVRSTVQVYPGGWTAIRVHDDDPNPAKERPPPANILLCGKLESNMISSF
ncbi:Monocopper oxidase-like protein SKU5, partial [Linum grandiflorum]